MVVTTILTYLAANKVIIVGAAVTISELVTIGVNLYRKLKAEKTAKVMANTETAKPFHRKLLWAANPINLFRKP